MTTIRGQTPSVPTPTPAAGPPTLPAPGPRPLTIAAAPAELRPQDASRHGRHLRAAQAVVQVQMTAKGPHAQPRRGPHGEKTVVNSNPIRPDEARFAGVAFLDVCRMAAHLHQADGFAKAAQSLDRHCQQVLGRQFNAGVVSGVLEQAVTLHGSLLNASRGEKAVMIAVGALLLTAEAVPGLNVGLNYVLGLLGAEAIAEEIGHSLQDIGKGDSFAAGQKAGKAAIDALLAASSLKHSKLLQPLMENLAGAKVSTLVASTWQQLAHTVPKIELPTVERTVATLKLGLEHVLAHIKPNPVKVIGKTTVESTHLGGPHHGGHAPGHGHDEEDAPPRTAGHG